MLKNMKNIVYLHYWYCQNSRLREAVTHKESTIDKCVWLQYFDHLRNTICTVVM